MLSARLCFALILFLAVSTSSVSANDVSTLRRIFNEVVSTAFRPINAQLNLDAMGRYPTAKPVAMQGALSSLSGGSFVEVAAASRQASDALSVTPEDVRKQLKELPLFRSRHVAVNVSAHTQ
ncbi:unnamed protein product [Vitrella brassicaformis CCMP3155]|uniref:PS II complex 12 kDa extrinsic protein n=1 Tax=Vitrella brassicaformis (strain CCMP3155) TaxID=1169540 RepID=A0A0G4EXU4_VITBC|nr:unnamed protein product [Vitrella brassicaformis CCMP3155]|eukprot:CEM04134.1 unnamed protein product [Vitrella brassicaformis CCMP3155]